MVCYIAIDNQNKGIGKTNFLESITFEFSFEELDFFDM